jgi:SNF2 family DNA or RNA helicase
VEQVTAPPYELQALATDYVVQNRHCILDYGMGTGKSRALVDAMSAIPYPLTIIFVPKAVLEQGHWAAEFKKWAPEGLFEVRELVKGTMKKRLERAVAPTKAKPGGIVLVINYAALLNKEWVAWIQKVKPGLIVYDEIHKLKSPTGKQSRAALKIQPHAASIVGLTGTLLPHSPLDGFGIFRAVKPDLFGWSFTKYRNRYAVMGGFQNYEVKGWQNQAELASRMSRITIRATREEMLDLPKATHIRVPIKLSPLGQKAYQTMETAFIAEIEGGIITAVNGLVKLLRLQQITSGEIRSDDGTSWLNVDTSKKEALIEILSDTDEPVVVFGRFSSDLHNVHMACVALDEDYHEVSGNQNDLRAWREGAGRVLGVQIGAGAEGVDLTRASICVFLSTGFSLGQFEQALCRLDRPGQTKPVVYYYLVATGTVDEYVYKSLKAKKVVVQDVLKQMGGQ